MITVIMILVAMVMAFMVVVAMQNRPRVERIPLRITRPRVVRRRSRY